MSTLNIPSYNALLSRDRQIKSIQDLYENLSKMTPIDPGEIEQLKTAIGTIEKVIPSEASEDNQLADKEWVTEELSEKEDTVTIEAVSSVISSLSAEVNKYYRIDVPAETLAITLPTITDATSVKSIVFYLTGGTTPAITFTSTHNVYYSKDFGIESGKTYEVNTLYNGDAWIVASLEIEIPTIPVETRVVCKYNVEDISDPISLTYNYHAENIESMEIDGVELSDSEIIDLYDNHYGEYTFTSSGEHVVKFSFNEKYITNEGFQQLNYLTSVYIPDDYETIYAWAFYNCEKLQTCVIGNGVTSIGMEAFKDCTSLTSCTIGSGVTSIEDNAFDGCSSLTSINIPNSVTSIGDYAFQYCNITSIDIPNSVTNIDFGAFYNCSSLTSITVEATTPPTIGSEVFSDTNDCPIYVPSDSVDAYKAASGWSDYALRIQAIPTA